MSINDADMIARLMEWEREHGADDGTNICEKLFLYSCTRHIQPDRMVEIGVSAGGATSWIAAALTINGSGHLKSVDDWSQSDGGLSDNPEVAKTRLWSLNLAQKVTLIGENSHDWMPRQNDNSADIVWVDGDHSYEGAKDDVTHALRIAQRLVIVHDTDHLPGPRRLADELEHRGVRMRKWRGFLLLNPS